MVIPLGGDTRVRTIRNRMNIPTMAPSLLMRSMSVILTALADLTRNITDILKYNNQLRGVREGVSGQLHWDISPSDTDIGYYRIVCHFS